MNEYLYLGHEEDEKNDIYFLSQTLKKKKNRQLLASRCV